MEIGCVVTNPGSAAEYRTGDWRSQRPIRDYDICIKCGVCYIFCPEGSISLNSGEDFITDLYYCKGCGICAKECRKQAIAMVEEE